MMGNLLKTGLVLSVLVVLLMPCSSADAATEEIDDEYWCYGDHLNLSYGTDIASISWKVTDPRGTVLEQQNGFELDYTVPPEYSQVIVTQTATTGYGSSDKRICVNLMHFDERRTTVYFHESADGPVMDKQVFDGYTVCKNGVFLELPEQPAEPNDNVVFGGWFTNENGEEVEVTEGYAVTSTSPAIINVNPKWLATHSITCLSQGQVFVTRVVVEGETFTPEVPDAPPGKHFGGWYLDIKLTQPYNSSMELPDSQVLYAKWVDDEEGSLFTPFLLIPLGAVAVVGVISYMKKQKKKTAKKKRYL